MWNVEEEGPEVLYFVAGVNKICAASGGERKKRVGKWEEGRSYGGEVGGGGGGEEVRKMGARFIVNQFNAF